MQSAPDGSAAFGPRCADGEKCEHAIYLEEYERVDRIYAAKVKADTRAETIEECARECERERDDEYPHTGCNVAQKRAADIRRLASAKKTEGT